MQSAAVFLFALVLIASGCSESTTGAGGMGGTRPPPTVDKTCREYCANESGGFSCYEGPPDMVQACYEQCLRDYQQEESKGCGDEWIAIKGCQVGLDCSDLFGDCDSAEEVYDTCRTRADADTYCAASCPMQDRQACIEQYLATGGCGAPVVVVVDAQWNLTCPADTEVDCGTLATETCLGSVGQRAILGVPGELACTGDAIVAICNSVHRSDGTRSISLEANVDRDSGGFPRFAFELEVRIDSADSSVESCDVTITEDQVPYDIGGCGEEPPSMTQPCQLSNISTGNGEVSFAIECRSLISSVTGTSGFDVGAVGGGPTTIQFANCKDF